MKNEARNGITSLAVCLLIALPCFAQAAPVIFGDTGVEKRSAKVSSAIQEIAAEQDKTPDKNWFPTGSRVFKSGYKNAPNDVKAAFAMDLQDFANSKGEKLDNITDTYVPYKKREEFAMWWWLMHSQEYKKALPWDKDQWKYEAIIDGTQLRWKAAERMGTNYSASQVMGHDGLMAQLLQNKEK
ncbi:MAG: hypothetical protein K2X81_28710 [Candidatus Obscuribacterales bacterium]|nr:hypothetical protein [Candidatus Obscuribacterales bacterium]